MGTLDHVINKVREQETKENLLDQAKEAEGNSNYKTSQTLLIESIKQNTIILKQKPLNNTARQSIQDALEIMATLTPQINDFNLPNINTPQQNTYSFKNNILALFKEKNWKTQYNGKFGGTKHHKLSWKNYYAKNEKEFIKLESNEKKLEWAITHGHIKIITTLINKNKTLIKKKSGYLLEIAIKKGFTAITKLLIENGAPINTSNSDKWTPLHWACHTENMNLVSYLLNKKSKINTKDKYNLMPIHIATLHGNTDIVSCLVKHKAQINIKEKRYQLTPIQLAAHQNHIACLNLLIDLKANIKQTDQISAF